MRLAPRAEKCSRRSPKFISKWNHKFCKNAEHYSKSRPDAKTATSSSPCYLQGLDHIGELQSRPQNNMRKEVTTLSAHSREFWGHRVYPPYLQAPGHIGAVWTRPTMPPRALARRPRDPLGHPVEFVRLLECFGGPLRGVFRSQSIT